MGSVSDDSREGLALSDPPENLDGFPAVSVPKRPWFRAHRAALGPWWFSRDGSGRFDLPYPDGTCYLASSVETAVRERLGPTLSRANQITGDEADTMVVSRLHADGTFADTIARDANLFGVTRELGTMTPYGLPQCWARAFHRAGYDGLMYWPRFSLGPDQHALALFGSAGADASRLTDPAPTGGRVAAAHAKITVIGIPRSLDTIDPPPRDE